MSNVILNGKINYNSNKAEYTGKWHFLKDLRPKNSFYYEVRKYLIDTFKEVNYI